MTVCSLHQLVTDRAQVSAESFVHLPWPPNPPHLHYRVFEHCYHSWVRSHVCFFHRKFYFSFSRHVSDTLGKVLLERFLLNSEALNPNRKQIPKLRFWFVSSSYIRRLNLILRLRFWFTEISLLLLSQGWICLASLHLGSTSSDNWAHEDPLWQPPTVDEVMLIFWWEWDF